MAAQVEDEEGPEKNETRAENGMGAQSKGMDRERRKLREEGMMHQRIQR